LAEGWDLPFERVMSSTKPVLKLVEPAAPIATVMGDDHVASVIRTVGLERILAIAIEVEAAA
jgi:hypothetical protein